jgi:hypothetical protein
VFTIIFGGLLLFTNPSGLLLPILGIGFIGLLFLLVALAALGFRSREIPVENLPPIVEAKNVQHHETRQG